MFKQYVEKPVLLKNIFGKTTHFKRQERKPRDVAYWKMMFPLGHFELQVCIWVCFKIIDIPSIVQIQQEYVFTCTLNACLGTTVLQNQNITHNTEGPFHEQLN